jgi:tetratricopeptide (TPR) repeat protein
MMLATCWSTTIVAGPQPPVQFFVKQPKPSDIPNPRTADDYRRRAELWEHSQEFDKAIADYTAAIRLDAERATLYVQRGRAFFAKGAYDKVVADCDQAIRLDPKSPWGYLLRAQASDAKEEYARAKSDLATVLRLDEKNFVACGNLAWLLATCPHDELRDGRRAVELAMQACEQSEWRRPELLDTLAAATAEAGDFVAAVRWQTKALTLAEGNDALQSDFRGHLALYQQRKPFRVPAKKR